MKKVLLLSIILAGGLGITGTILAQSRHTKTIQAKSQTSQYYCNTGTGMSQANNMHNSNMYNMMYGTHSMGNMYKMHNASGTMNHNQCITGTSFMMGNHMTNDSDGQTHHEIMR